MALLKKVVLKDTAEKILSDLDGEFDKLLLELGEKVDDARALNPDPHEVELKQSRLFLSAPETLGTGINVMSVVDSFVEPEMRRRGGPLWRLKGSLRGTKIGLQSRVLDHRELIKSIVVKSGNGISVGEICKEMQRQRTC